MENFWIETAKQVPALGVLVILVIGAHKGLHQIIAKFQETINSKDKYLEEINKEVLTVVKENTTISARTLDTLQNIEDHLKEHHK